MMQLALGRTDSDEFMDGLHLISKVGVTSLGLISNVYMCRYANINICGLEISWKHRTVIHRHTTGRGFEVSIYKYVCNIYVHVYICKCI